MAGQRIEIPKTGLVPKFLILCVVKQFYQNTS